MASRLRGESFMQPYVYDYLWSRPDLLTFIRHNPIWYRYLTRDPGRMRELDKEAKYYFGKTLSQRLEKISDQTDMINMLILFADSIKD